MWNWIAARQVAALTGLLLVSATLAAVEYPEDSGVTKAQGGVLPLPALCGTGQAGSPDCSGKLPPDWFAAPAERKIRLFSDLLDKMEGASADSFGVRGGVAKNTAGIGKRWKVVEPIADANQVDYGQLAYPVVVAVMWFFRGDDETQHSTLGETTQAAFLIVYPDGWNTSTEPIDNPVKDGRAPYRIVKLVKKPNEFAYKIEVTNASRFVDYCRTDPANPNSRPHPREVISQANFLTCPAASISPMTEAGFYRLTRNEAQAILARDGRTTWEKLRLQEIWNRDSTLNYPSNPTPAGLASYLSNFIPWIGDEGVWFTCGLGCCYANP